MRLGYVYERGYVIGYVYERTCDWVSVCMRGHVIEYVYER